MTFSKALEYLKKGRKIKLKSWNGCCLIYGSHIGDLDKEIYICTHELKAGQTYRYSFSQSDILSDDWRLA